MSTVNKSNISNKKTEELGFLSLQNSIRLHLDSIHLFNINSFPSSFMLSVLAIEEFATSEILEYLHYHKTTNEFADTIEFSERVLSPLFSHYLKQLRFVGKDMEISPKFKKFVKRKKLQKKKLIATHVGFAVNKRIENKTIPKFSSEITTPLSITFDDSKEQISIFNDTLIDLCSLNILQGSLYTISKMDELLDEALLNKLKSIWQYNSDIKSKIWFKHWLESIKNGKLISK